MVVLLSLLTTLYAVVQNPAVQTLGVRIIAAYFSREWKTEVRLGGFNFSLTKGVILDEVMVRDRNDSIMFETHRLAVQPDFTKLWSGMIYVNKVLVDGGQFQLITHKGDSLLNLEYILAYFDSGDTVQQPPDTTGEPFSVSGASVVIRNFRFHYQDCNEIPVSEGMDYANIDVRNLSISIPRFSVNGDTINASISSLQAVERSGLEILSFSGEASVCSQFVKVDQLRILTTRSDIDMDFAMLYDGYPSFLDFIRKVTLQGDLRPSVFNLADVASFAPELKQMDNTLRIEGLVSGTIDRFRARNLRVETGEGTRLRADLTASGLPDIYKTYIDLTLHELVSGKKDIEAFRLPAGSPGLVLPEVMENLGEVKLTGRFTGFWDAFTADFNTQTAMGNANGNLQLKRLQPGGTFTYEGQVAVASLQAGVLLDADPLVGRTTFRGTVSGRGLSFEKADVTMNISIDSLVLNRYNYRRITVNGTLSDQEFDGLLSFRDPNIWLDFNGSADFHDTLPSFDFNALIHHAQLFKLHLVERDSVQNVSGEILARFTGNTIDNLEGMLRLDECVYTEGERIIDLNNLLIKTNQDFRANKSFHLESDFVDADFSGVFSFSNMIYSAEQFIRNYLASFNLQDSLRIATRGVPQVTRFIVELHDTKEVTDLFLPWLEISPGTILSGYFDTEQDVIRLDGSSPLIRVYGMDLESWSLDAESTTTELNLTTGCRQFYISDSEGEDTLDVKLARFEVSASVRRDSILYDIGWDSPYGKSFVNGSAMFPDDGSVRITQEQFNVRIKQRLWNLALGNLVVVDSVGIGLHDLLFSSEGQTLAINGVISDRQYDTLNMEFGKLDVSDLDYFIGNPDVDLDGILGGRMKLWNILGDISFLSDLTLEKFRFNKELLGDALIEVDYDNQLKRFAIDARILYTGNIGQNIPIAVKGTYRMGTESGIDFNVNLRNLNLKMAQPFISDVVPRISGLISGEARITGTLEKPDVSGELKLMRTEFVVGYLNVPYSVSDVIKVEPGKLLFNNLTLYDSIGNKASLNGTITHQHFSNFNLNLEINMVDFSAFNNTLAQNPVFYGNARATGQVRITGAPEEIHIGVRAQTGSKTHVVIPINLTEDVGQLNYIIFEEPGQDSGLVQQRAASPAGDYPLYLDLNLAVNPDAEVEVFLPSQLGNLKASGKGNLTMTMTPRTGFSLNGSYVISKGSFLLQLRSLLRLPFTISEGSRITWTGDPADADIALSAMYRTKVPLAGLTTDEELAALRVNTECILRLRGKLLNPVYEFGLNMVNAEESVKTLVYNSIDTTNQLEMSQQVLSVLILNQFNPTVGSTPGLEVSGTSLSIVSNQINSMLSRLSNNVNVNLNYSPGSSSTSQEFDVGLSTQFLDDRLLIDGTFGMSSYTNPSSQQTNTIVGDINIEYVLTKNRRWRIRAFNRTNTIEDLYNNATYTQGIGISYQREFSTLKELFSRKKKSN